MPLQTATQERRWRQEDPHAPGVVGGWRRGEKGLRSVASARRHACRRSSASFLWSWNIGRGCSAGREQPEYAHTRSNGQAGPSQCGKPCATAGRHRRPWREAPSEATGLRGPSFTHSPDLAVFCPRRRQVVGAELSGPDKRRLSTCRALVMDPKTMGPNAPPALRQALSVNTNSSTTATTCVPTANARLGRKTNGYWCSTTKGGLCR